MQFHVLCSFTCSDELSFNAGAGNMPYGPAPLGNKGVRKTMHLEDHHNIPKDCMDLGGVPDPI